MEQLVWRDKYMSLAHLHECESQVSSITAHKHPEVNNIAVNAINLLFRLSYFFPKEYETDSDEHHFGTFAFFTYTRLPYDCEVTRDLWLKGYYSQSIVLLRRILESFVAVRYFSHHKSRIKRHLYAQSQKDRVQFKVMFEFFAPGAYEELYAKCLCGVAHGGLSNIIFQGDFDPSRPGRMNMGTAYSARYSSYTINQLLAYCLGYIALANLIVPNLEDRFPKHVRNNRDLIVAHFRNRFSKSRTQAQKEFAERFLGPVLGVDMTI